MKTKAPSNQYRNASQIRAAFWRDHPQFKAEFVPGKLQNAYRVDIREAFVNFLDAIHKSGAISTHQAYDTVL